MGPQQGGKRLPNVFLKNRIVASMEGLSSSACLKPTTFSIQSSGSRDITHPKWVLSAYFGPIFCGPASVIAGNQAKTVERLTKYSGQIQMYLASSKPKIGTWYDVRLANGRAPGV